jgi:predicted lipoprotein with Yx(FWY)xxD motif
MNTFSRRSLRFAILAVVAAAAAVALAACGSSDNGSTATAATTPSGNDTVSMMTVDGAGSVLVDSQGNALYTPDQEASGKIMCTGECNAVWMPLTAGNTKPTAASNVSGKLGTVKRPDGSTQVTLDGKPLYTFTEDGGPGNVTGDGVTDSFGGQSFTWHVIGDTGSSSSGGGSGTTTQSSSSGGYSY